MAPLVGAFLAAGCHEPTNARRAVSPAVGTFDFTTSLDSFTYFTVIADNGVYHHSTIPATAAALSGILTIHDSSIAVSPSAARLPVYEATLQETPCLEKIGGPCDTAMPSYALDFASGSALSINGDTLDAPAYLYGGSEAVTLRRGRVFADSIVGTVEWFTKMGPTGRSYVGTFVARRRR